MPNIETALNSVSLQFWLLVATGLLAICLLALALTRWGQSSTLWKCVVLSVASHILLVVFAYGTHLISIPPQTAGFDSSSHLRVTLIADADESPEEPIEALPKWEQSHDFELFPSIAELLARPEIDSELVLQRVMPFQEHEPTAPGTLQDFDPTLFQPSFSDFLPDTARKAWKPDAFSALALPAQNDVPPEAAIELPDPPSSLERETAKIDSPEINVERREESDPSLTEPPKFVETLDLPKLERVETTSEFKSPTAANDGIAKDDHLADSIELPEFAPPHFSQLPARQVAPESVDPSLAKSFPNLPDVRFRKVSSVRRISDGKPVPELYSLRNAADRQQLVSQRGGSSDTEEAVAAGLKWLIDHQEDDGRWDADRWGAGIERRVYGHDRNGAGAEADTGITGLAILALLAGGDSHLEGSHRSSLQRALNFLIQQQRADGDLAGKAKLYARTYCHSIALLALSETLAVTGDHRLMQAVQRGVNYSIRSQNRNDGGWRYQPGDTGDMSQHGWQVLALYSAKTGGASVPDEVFDRMRGFLDRCAIGPNRGLAAYRPNEGPSTSMTAESLVCRFILDHNLNPSLVREASRRITAERPSAQHVNLYYWYYGTLAMYQVGGQDWDRWNADMKRALLTTQVKSGEYAGSWNPDCLWGGYGGRVYSTALSALNLQVYYRYLPNHQVASTDSESGRR